MIRCAVYGFGLGVIALFVSVVYAPQASADDCRSVYALVSVKQQKENESKQCGFSSSGDVSWSKDIEAHVTWCSSQRPQTWRAVLQTRQEMLANCG